MPLKRLSVFFIFIFILFEVAFCIRYRNTFYPNKFGSCQCRYKNRQYLNQKRIEKRVPRNVNTRCRNITQRNTRNRSTNHRNRRNKNVNVRNPMNTKRTVKQVQNRTCKRYSRRKSNSNISNNKNNNNKNNNNNNKNIDKIKAKPEKSSPFVLPDNRKEKIKNTKINLGSTTTNDSITKDEVETVVNAISLLDNQQITQLKQADLKKRNFMHGTRLTTSEIKLIESTILANSTKILDKTLNGTQKCIKLYNCFEFILKYLNFDFKTCQDKVYEIEVSVYTFYNFLWEKLQFNANNCFSKNMTNVFCNK